MARIFIFRHGQTDDNKNKIFSGWRDPDLNEEGIKESQSLRDKLRGEKPTKAYASDQIRCVHTLQIVLEPHQKVEVFQDVRIRERDYGDLTGQSKIEWEKKDPINYKLWHRSYDVAPTNGESIAMVEKRVIPFLEDLKANVKPPDVVFISTSANSIRPMRKYFEKLSNEEMSTFEHTPTAIYEYQL
jgi:2,3-bisphosphoglycerate-dependent phosphoglycerate mutase